MSTIKKLGQYKDLEVTVAKKEATKDEVEAQVQALVMQNPKMVEKDGPVANGDITTIDFEGFKDGVAFDGGKAEGHQLTIGSGQFIPGFEDQMIGMVKDEVRELNLTFPENYGVEDLAGADVVFKVTLHKIENRIDAELNDEFVASLQMPNISTVEELYKQMESFIQSNHDQEYTMNIQNAVFDQLLNASEVEVSEEDIEVAMNEHLNQLRMELGRQGLPLEQYIQMMGMTEEDLRAQLKPNATQQAKFEAVIDAIVEAENISTTDEEIEKQIEMIALQNQMPKEKVVEHINKESLKNDYNRFKASQVVVNSAKVSAE